MEGEGKGDSGELEKGDVVGVDGGELENGDGGGGDGG